MNITELREKVEATLIPPDDDETFDHIAATLDATHALCGHRFRETAPDGFQNHTPFDFDNPYRVCICGARTCPKCIDLAFLYEQVGDMEPYYPLDF